MVTLMRSRIPRSDERKIDIATLRRARHNLMTELKAIETDLAAHAACHERQLRERAMVAAVARSKVFRDGTEKSPRACGNCPSIRVARLQDREEPAQAGKRADRKEQSDHAVSYG